MSAFACKSCGQSWPSNYCPTCHATIDRSELGAVAIPAPPPAWSSATPTAPSPRPTDALPPANLQRGKAPPGEAVPFEFTGNAGEYFRIWIVNVALTVLTLGIYAAWAKVRKRRYFWSNVQLGGRSFEYTGNPIAILKGNLIFAVFAIAYYLLIQVEPRLGYVSLFGFWLVYPWLYYKAMRFNAWNTRYRNIRFGFHGTLGESYAVNLGLLMLVPLTVGGIWPYMQYRRRRYQVGNLSFGNANFRYDGTVGTFYEYGLKTFGLMVLGIVIGLVVGAIVFSASGLALGPAELIGIFLVYLSVAGVIGIYYPTRITNVVFARSSIEGLASFRSWLKVREVLGMEFVNLLAIVCTLGLATPWAAVRRAQYRWSHMEVRLTGPLEQVSAAAATAPGAVGDAVAEQLDIDISF